MRKMMPLLSVAAMLLTVPALAQGGANVSGQDKAPDVIGGSSRKSPPADSDQARPDDQSAEQRDRDGQAEGKNDGQDRPGATDERSGDVPKTFQLNRGETPLGGNAPGTSKGEPGSSRPWPSQ